MGEQNGRSLAAAGIGWCFGLLATASVVPAWPVIFLASLTLVGYGLAKGGNGK